MAASLIISSSAPGPTSSLISHSPALSTAGYYASSRVSKRPCETSSCKRTVRSRPERDCGKTCSSSRNSVLETAEANITVEYHSPVPSGSMDSTTNPRRTTSNYHSKKHGNTQPYSPNKTARKKARPGKGNKPASPTLSRGRPHSPERGSNPASPTLRRGRPPSPHPTALKSAADGSMLSTSKIALMQYKAKQSTEEEETEPSPAVDSTHADELSNNFDSDLQTKPSSCPLAPSQLSATLKHPDSPASDADDDLFVDALSNLPSADEQECSASTSAFVTPLTSRCQSPLLPPTDSSGAVQEDEHFAQSLTNSLQEIEAKQTKKQAKLESIEKTDLVVLGSATGSSESSSDGKALESVTAEEEKKVHPKKRLNGIVQDHSMVEPQSSVVAEQPKNAKKQGKKKKRGASNFTDSNCDSSIPRSDLPSAIHPNLKVPKELPSQNAKKRGKNRKSNQHGNLESTSISSTSPSSSVCSHSPLAMSPPPISVEQSIHPLLLHKILPDNSNLNSTSTKEEAADGSTSEGKDEWPDLGMESSIPIAKPPPPEPRVHLHLDVEAKALELSCDFVEREDSGCGMSVASSESSTAGFRLQSLEPIAAAAAPYPGNWITGEILPAQFSDAHLKSQHYLWCQRQQLHMFVQQHMEQQEQQTDKQIFYPVDPIPEAPSPPCIPLATSLMPSPLLFQQVPHNQIDPRPLFFPRLPLHDTQVSEKSADVACPPCPPPPPPLPVHPYCPPASSSWTGTTDVPEDTASKVVADQAASEVIADHTAFKVVMDGATSKVVTDNAPLNNIIIDDATSEVVADDTTFTVVTDDKVTVDSATSVVGADVVGSDVATDCGADEETEGVSAQEEEVYEHHLSDTWVMWYDRITGTTRNHSADYQASLIQLLSISTIEEFWQLYNNIKTPDLLEQNSNFHFFKRGIKPLWEHSANLDGGKWVFTIKNDTNGLTKSWLEVLLLLIGGCCKRHNQINGAVVSRRKKGDRISLWTNTRKLRANLDICVQLVKSLIFAYGIKVEDIKSFLEKLAEGKSGFSLVFTHHRDALKSGHSYQNDAHITLVDHLDVILQELKKIL